MISLSIQSWPVACHGHATNTVLMMQRILHLGLKNFLEVKDLCQTCPKMIKMLKNDIFMPKFGVTIEHLAHIR